MRQIALCLTLLLLSTGCQRTRSFLHMNSNSSSPFMGLELSVDAKSRPNNNERTLRNVSLNSSMRSLLSKASRSSTEVVNISRPANDGHTDSQPLPQVDLDTKPELAAEVEHILSRFSGG